MGRHRTRGPTVTLAGQPPPVDKQQVRRQVVLLMHLAEWMIRPKRERVGCLLLRRWAQRTLGPSECYGGDTQNEG